MHPGIAVFARYRPAGSHVLRWILAGLCVLGGMRTERLGAEIPVHRFSEVPHLYWKTEPRDAFSRLLESIRSGEFVLERGDQKAQLAALLRGLDVPESSQLLAYSATSLQSGLILPSNPRAIYFNEEVYVGFVPNGKFEVASIDPALGPVFYLFRMDPAGRAEAVRSERCMNCHAGRTSLGVPGLVAESVIATPSSGASLDGFRREITGHSIPLHQRLGGWHVTGVHEKSGHLGNLLGEAEAGGYRTIPNLPGSRFLWENYPVRTSDLLAHLVFEHQLGFHNLVTLAAYRARDAAAAGNGVVLPEHERELDEVAAKLVRYLLFAEEASLPPGGVQADPVFLKAFTSRRLAGASGKSLRDFDLGERLFKYRCSYMIYTRGFASLPAEVKPRILSKLRNALTENGGPEEFQYLPDAEKKAIREILVETGVLQ